jgi:hypothetical protein
LLVTDAMRAKAIIFVLAVAIVSGCFGTKRGPRGTNIGTGSDNDGPWSGGASPALVQQP